MSLATLKVFHDGSQFIARLGTSLTPPGKRGSNIVNEAYEKFKVFFKEACEKNVAKWKICDYIQGRFVDTNETLFDIPDIDTVKEFFKRYITTIHKRKVRYERKLYFNDWSYFVTFTYSDQKMTQEEFEEQIRTKLSDLSSHKDWYYMMRWENGELGERKHLHAFVYVPDGQMVGELYKDKHFSHKRHRWEFFTNNTYFNERFGVSDWIELKNNKIAKSLMGYFAKYMAKNDGKIIYSRGIPNEIEAEIDVDEDIITTYEKDHTFYGVVDRFIFGTPEDKAEALKKALRFDLKAEPVPI